MTDSKKPSAEGRLNNLNEITNSTKVTKTELNNLLEAQFARYDEMPPDNQEKEPSDFASRLFIIKQRSVENIDDFISSQYKTDGIKERSESEHKKNICL